MGLTDHDTPHIPRNSALTTARRKELGRFKGEHRHDSDTAYSPKEFQDTTQIAALEAATTPEQVLEILGAVQA